MERIPSDSARIKYLWAGEVTLMLGNIQNEPEDICHNARAQAWCTDVPATDCRTPETR
jgi:hypothetical protein